MGSHWREGAQQRQERLQPRNMERVGSKGAWTEEPHLSKGRSVQSSRPSFNNNTLLLFTEGVINRDIVIAVINRNSTTQRLKEDLKSVHYILDPHLQHPDSQACWAVGTAVEFWEWVQRNSSGTSEMTILVSDVPDRTNSSTLQGSFCMCSFPTLLEKEQVCSVFSDEWLIL